MSLRLIPRIHRVTHRIALSLDRATSLGVTQGEAHVLVHLIEHGDATIAEVHRAFAHRRSTLTSILDRLVARGLIRRETGETDRRTFVLRLTPVGRPHARKVLRHLELMESRVLRKVSLAAVHEFERVMTALEASITS